MMVSIPGHGAPELRFWRLDSAPHAPRWDTGIGAQAYGGRWNRKGQAVVYAALDPATAILEVAVHKGFDTLDTAAHVMTCARVDDPSQVHVVEPDQVPNPNWLVPGSPSAGQQAFGTRLLMEHAFVLLPSVVSRSSWNLLFSPARAAGSYRLLAQQAFALDPRLHPA